MRFKDLELMENSEVQKFFCFICIQGVPEVFSHFKNLYKTIGKFSYEIYIFFLLHQLFINFFSSILLRQKRRQFVGYMYWIQDLFY